MEQINVFLGCSNIIVALFIMGINVPLVFGKIPMNRLYGMRFKQSFASEDNWYAINKHGGKLFIISSIPLIFIGCLAFFLPFAGNETLKFIFSIAPVFVFIVPTYLSYRYAKKF